MGLGGLHFRAVFQPLWVVRKKKTDCLACCSPRHGRLHTHVPCSSDQLLLHNDEGEPITLLFRIQLHTRAQVFARNHTCTRSLFFSFVCYTRLLKGRDRNIYTPLSSRQMYAGIKRPNPCYIYLLYLLPCGMRSGARTLHIQTWVALYAPAKTSVLLLPMLE